MKKYLPVFVVIIFFSISSHANAALTDGLQGYWKLDESSNGSSAVTRNDSTANNNALADVNTTASGVGIINNGADFERTNGEYLTISDATQTGLDITGDIAESLWFKPETNPASGEEYAFTWKTAVGGSAYTFSYINNAGTNQLVANLYDNNTPTTNVPFRNNQTLSNGTWHHIVFSYDTTSNTMTFYLNGSNVGTSTGEGIVDQINNSAGSFNVGDDGMATRSTDGIIDEVGIWARELTVAEVAELYNGRVGLQYPFSTSTPSITGSGTTNRVAKFTSTNTIGDSIFSDDGSNVTLTSGNLFFQPGAMLDVITGGVLNLGVTIATSINIGRTGATTTFLGPIVTGAITFSSANTSQNCASSTSPAVCGSAPAGSVRLPTGGSTLIVNTTAVTANSQILITEDSSLGLRLGVTCNTATGRTYSVSTRIIGTTTSFTIKSDKNPVINGACLNYWIIN